MKRYLNLLASLYQTLILFYVLYNLKEFFKYSKSLLEKSSDKYERAYFGGNDIKFVKNQTFQGSLSSLVRNRR